MARAIVKSHPKKFSTFVRAEGNGGEVITDAVTDIPFTEVSDISNAWDGNSYLVQNSSSIVSILGHIQDNGANYDVYLYKNGVAYKAIGQRPDTGSGFKLFSYKSIEGEFVINDNLSIRAVAGSPAIANDATAHYINIIEEWEE